MKKTWRSQYIALIISKLRPIVVRRFESLSGAKKNPCKQFVYKGLFLFSAEREGFKPPVPFSTAVFKTAAIDHSAISPGLFAFGLFPDCVAKVVHLLNSANV